MKQRSSLQKLFEHNKENKEKWLQQKSFKIPLESSLDWTKPSDNPYKIDMSRYFTNITEELDKWLVKDGKVRFSTDTAESRLHEDDEEDDDVDNSPIAGKNVTDFHWLVDEKANFNPMASYLRMNSDLSKWKKTKASIPIQ